MAGGAAGTGAGIQSGSMFFSIVMSAFAAFGGILFGYDTGTISGIIAMDNWLETFGTFDPVNSPNLPNQPYYLPTNDTSLVVSILSAGTFFGALTAYPMGDLLGRKWGLIASCAVFCVGVGLQLDTSFGVFVAGRVIAGFGVGLVSCLVPMYQSECSPASVRGFVVGCYQWAITIGLLLASIVNNSTQYRNSAAAWRIPIAVQFAWAVVLSVGMFFLPESPRYLLFKGREAQARKSLGRLTSRPENSPEVDQECINITLALDAERALGKTGYLDCFRGGESKTGLRTLTGIFLQAWQQLTGINFIFYYGTTFFNRSGIAGFTVSIITNVVNVVMTVPGILLIDRFGRRSMLLWGAVGMCVCEFIVAIVGVTVGSPAADGTLNLTAQRVLIAFVCIYIAFFASTWGPIAWVVTGEIFPLAIRAKAMSMSTASNWLWNFGIGYATPYLVNPTTFGPTGTRAANLGVKVFFIWGSTCLGCVVFTYFCIPETKGLTLEQVDLLYRESTVIKSNAYRKQMLENHETYAHHTTGIVDPKHRDLEHHEMKGDNELRV